MAKHKASNPQAFGGFVLTGFDVSSSRGTWNLCGTIAVAWPFNSSGPRLGGRRSSSPNGGARQGDLILGLKSSAIGTLVERSTRFTLLLHLPPMPGHGTGPRKKERSRTRGTRS